MQRNGSIATQMEEQRLVARLFKLKLDMFVMEGDGNCQFRAAAFGLFGKLMFEPLLALT
jgi:hypothetical protein